VGLYVGLYLWTICFFDFLSSLIGQATTGGWMSRSLSFLSLYFPCGAMRKTFSVPDLLPIYRTWVTKVKIPLWGPHQMCFNVCRMKLSIWALFVQRKLLTWGLHTESSIFLKSVPSVRMRVCLWVCHLLLLSFVTLFYVGPVFWSNFSMYILKRCHCVSF
jgi:hypothetical protein